MKTTFLTSFLLAFLLGSPPLFSQEKIALIVAIGDYAPESGWMKISSENDIPLVKNALLQQGFKEESIYVIQDADATRDGIIRAIQTHLIGNARSGGMVYFHYSGHGQQVADDNSDELDGYDEALVPYDSPMMYMAGEYEGENLLRDEELGALLDEVRLRLGPSGNLLAVVDACHSGTGTRGMSPARGTDVIMAPANYKVTHRGTASSDLNGFEGRRENNLAPMVAFFGAAPNQLNFETKDESGNGVGSLSYAFSKKFTEANKNSTYRGLFDQIKLEMSSIAPRQQPQAEGLLDQEILGGNIVGKTIYFQVKNYNDASTLVIGGGWLQGVNEGAKIGFYPPETREHSSETPIMTGTVAKASPLEAVVYLDGDIDKITALGAWAMVLENSFGNLSVSVKLGIENNQALLAAFNEKMKPYPILKLEEAADLFVIERGGKIQLLTKDDFVLAEVNSTLSSNAIAHRFVKKMIGFGQAKFLRNLEVSSYYIPLEFEFVPVEYDHRNQRVLGNIPITDKIDAAGNLHFQDGDAFQIKVFNQGEKSAYFTLLDIQPDNQVNILIPGSNEVPADFRVAPGDAVLVPTVFEIAPPAGNEVFKLVATDEPIDLGSIVQTRGQTKNASPNPFERLFAETHFTEDVMTRGGRTLSIGSSKVNVFSQVFIID